MEDDSGAGRLLGPLGRLRPPSPQRWPLLPAPGRTMPPAVSPTPGWRLRHPVHMRHAAAAGGANRLLQRAHLDRGANAAQSDRVGDRVRGDDERSAGRAAAETRVLAAQPLSSGHHGERAAAVVGHVFTVRQPGYLGKRHWGAGRRAGRVGSECSSLPQSDPRPDLRLSQQEPETRLQELCAEAAVQVGDATGDPGSGAEDVRATAFDCHTADDAATQAAAAPALRRLRQNTEPEAAAAAAATRAAETAGLRVDLGAGQPAAGGPTRAVPRAIDGRHRRRLGQLVGLSDTAALAGESCHRRGGARGEGVPFPGNETRSVTAAIPATDSARHCGGCGSARPANRETHRPCESLTLRPTERDVVTLTHTLTTVTVTVTRTVAVTVVTVIVVVTVTVTSTVTAAVTVGVGIGCRPAVCRDVRLLRLRQQRLMVATVGGLLADEQSLVGGSRPTAGEASSAPGRSTPLGPDHSEPGRTGRVASERAAAAGRTARLLGGPTDGVTGARGRNGLGHCRHGARASGIDRAPYSPYQHYPGRPSRPRPEPVEWT